MGRYAGQFRGKVRLPTTQNLRDLAWLDTLVPAAALAAAGPEKRGKLRLLVAIWPALLVLGLAGAWVAHRSGLTVSGHLSLLASACWFLVLPTLWLTRSSSAAGSWVPLGIFLNLAGQGALAWNESLSLVFLFVVPLSAVLLIGMRHGWIWGSVILASAWPLAVIQAERLGPGAPPPLMTAWITSSFTVVVTGAFMLIETLRNRALAEAEAARVRAEDASRRLAAEQARFRALSEDSFQTITETDRNGIVLYANPRFEEVLGYTPDEMVGRHPSALLADPPKAGTPPVETLMKSGERFEILNRHRDGHHVWQEVVASRYQTPAGEERWIFAGRDVTRERAEREQLRATQKLESLGVLAGGVAHDFNNLLTVIAGYADELDDSEASVEIRRAAERAAALIAQLLAFGRKQVLRPRRVTLDDLVRDLQNVLRSLIREEVKLELELDSAPWCVEVDPNQIQRVLVNLATNARDAMPTGGSLRIATSRCTLDEKEAAALGVPPGDHACLVVTDTGTGMEADTRDRAFEPFFTTKEVGDGTGLGLASVYGIVEQSHGGIRLRSAPGSGTEVSLYFPRCEREPVQQGSQERREHSGGAAPANAQVLLVEDDASVRRLAAETLRRGGFRVLDAESGPAALALLADDSISIDLLVSDVIMPEMRGPELAARLRVREPGLPVLFVSGYNDQQVSLGDRETAATGFLAKPFPPGELVRLVRGLLEG